MTISEKQKIIQQLYGGCERCLISPENPFTLDNPDVIVAAGNKLYAIYIPTFRENDNTDHLLRRLYLSQMSYGYKLIPVLLALEEGSVKMLNNYAFGYAFAHLTNSIEDVLSFVNQAHPNHRRSRYFSELQSSHYVLYRKYLQLSAEVHREVHSEFSASEERELNPIVTRSWSTERQKESTLFRRVTGGLVASVEKRRNASFKSAFEQLMTFTFMSKFNFDNGELFPGVMYNELSVMNTDWVMFDDNSAPNAYNNMLSFIGLPPVAVSTEGEIAQVFDRYQNIRDHGIV